MMKNTLIKSQQLFYLFLLIIGISCNYPRCEDKSLDYYFFGMVLPCSLLPGKRFREKKNFSFQAAEKYFFESTT